VNQYLILRRIGSLASKAAHLAAGPSPNESVSLQSLVILDVFLKLAQRIRRRGALGSSHERHDAWKSLVDGGRGEMTMTD
jgi:hypothetical protein